MGAESGGGGWTAFLGSIAAEASAQFDRVRHLIGNVHWLSAGEWHESIVRRLLAAHLPERFEVSTGFVRWAEGLVSRQLDVLVWDRLRTAPLLRDGEFVILPADGVVAVFEVKTTLTRRTLRDALGLLHPEPWRSYSNHLHLPGAEDKRPIRGVVAMRASRQFQKPDRLFAELSEFYRERFGGSRGVMQMRLGVTRVSSSVSTAGDFSEFFRPRFVNLLDAITVADAFHLEQVKLWGGGEDLDPGYLALAGQVDGHSLALARLVLLMRDLVNRRIDVPAYSGWAFRRDTIGQLASPALCTFGGSVDPAKLGLAERDVWRPAAPLW